MSGHQHQYSYDFGLPTSRSAPALRHSQSQHVQVQDVDHSHSFSALSTPFGDFHSRPMENRHRSFPGSALPNVDVQPEHPPSLQKQLSMGDRPMIANRDSIGGHESPGTPQGATVRHYSEAPGVSQGHGSGHMRQGSTPQAPENKEEGDQRPAWSELKTKAGKDRKRLPLACIACRRKKIRCSGEKPACKHCMRARIPCVYKVTPRKAAPRTDYMAMLDKRLKRMEDRVIKIIPKDPKNTSKEAQNLSRAVLKPPVIGMSTKANGAKKRSAEEAGLDLDAWATGGEAKSKKISTLPKPQEQLELEESTLLEEGKEFLPPLELQEHLAEVFFDHVYGQSYHLLHKPSFMRKLKGGRIPPVLTLAICAISARFSTHPQLRTEPAFLRGEEWAKPARHIALRRYDTPNITILTVYVILGLHEFGTCQGGRSWMFGGMAQRMAYALQLHRDIDVMAMSGDAKPVLSFLDKEIRRRTLWACFLMDRFNSSGTERPIFMAEHSVKIQLPIREDYFVMDIPGTTEDLHGNVLVQGIQTTSGGNPKENMGVAAYFVRTVALWGHLVQYINLGGKARDPHPMWNPESEFVSLQSKVDALSADLPEPLRNTPENLQGHTVEKTANQFLLMHILMENARLFTNRFALPSHPGALPSRDIPHQFLKEAAQRAVKAATAISLLLRDAIERNVNAPIAGYAAFLSSTVHVHGVFSKNSRRENVSKQYLSYNIRFLSKMKKHWGMFHYVAEQLKNLYRLYADAAKNGPSASGAIDGRPAIFQYGDWFDQYPHGVSKLDYEEAEEDKQEPGTEGALGQKPDLKSVEEFFATLPSEKKKQPRRSTKSKAELTQDATKKQHRISPTAHQFSSPPRQSPGSALNRRPNGLQAPTQTPPQHQSFDPLPSQHQSISAALNSPRSTSQPHNLFAPRSFQQAPSPNDQFFIPQPSNPMPQLDSSFAHPSYSDLDIPSADLGPSTSFLQSDMAQHHTSAHFFDPNQGPFISVPRHPSQTSAPLPDLHEDLAGLGPNYFESAPPGNGLGGPLSAPFGSVGGTDVMGGGAWYMPFNMSPPSIEAMAGDVDWGGDFAMNGLANLYDNTRR